MEACWDSSQRFCGAPGLLWVACGVAGASEPALLPGAGPGPAGPPSLPWTLPGHRHPRLPAAGVSALGGVWGWGLGQSGWGYREMVVWVGVFGGRGAT